MFNYETFVQTNTLFHCTIIYLSACSPSFKLGNYDDPYENVNRKSHEVNKAIDKKVLRPSSKVYSKVFGEKPRNAISNFSENCSPGDGIHFDG